MKLHTTAAALSVGLFWGVVLFLWTLISVQNGYGKEVLDLIATIYPSYEVTSQGAVLGLFWGFLDGFIATFIVVWLYNGLAEKMGSKKKKK